MTTRAATVTEAAETAAALAAERVAQIRARPEGSTPAGPVVNLLVGYDETAQDFVLVPLEASSADQMKTALREAWRRRPEFLLYVCEVEMDDGWCGAGVAIYLADDVVPDGLPSKFLGIDARPEVDPSEAVRWLPPDAMPFSLPWWPSARRSLRSLETAELDEAISEFLDATAAGGVEMQRNQPIAYGIGLGERMKRRQVDVFWFRASEEVAGTAPWIGSPEVLADLFSIGADRVMVVTRTVHLDAQEGADPELVHATVLAAVRAGATQEEVAKLDGVKLPGHDALSVGCLKLDEQGSPTLERAWILELVDGAEWSEAERLNSIKRSAAPAGDS